MRVEPNLVAIRIENFECPVAPPLQREGVTHRDPILLEPVMEGVDVLDFEMDLDGCFPAGTAVSVGARMNMIRASPNTTVQKSSWPGPAASLRVRAWRDP